MMNLRKLHRKAAPIVFVPLLLTALTGIAYRLGRSWFKIPDEVAEFFMTLHEGRFLGRPLVPVYVLLMGLGLIGMIVTGFNMLKPKLQSPSSKSKMGSRQIHGVLALIAFLPLLVSAATGIAYRLGKAWFGLSNQQAGVLLRIHQGSYLGQTLRPFYVLLIGLGLVGLLVTGIQMSSVFRKRKSQSSAS
jgi:PepSY-associated TM region